MTASRPATREELIARMRATVANDMLPRVTMSLVLGLSGAIAFLASFTLLRAGVDGMAVRYGLAAGVGYVVFLLLIRGWIRLHTPRLRGDRSIADHLDLAFDLPSGGRGGSAAPEPANLFAAGRSGGGGGGAGWEPQTLSAGGKGSGGSSGWGGELDLDELWWLVVAAVLALGALIAMAFVVYSAPALLAEVALDAAIVTPVYRRLRREDTRHWAGTVLRRTWIPALVVILFVAGSGFALQKAVPEARSIGGVWRAVLS